MYGRILYVDALPYGEASFGYRLREALKGLGHAFYLIDASSLEESQMAARLRAALRTFKPTTVWWDERHVAVGSESAQALGECSCLKVLVRHQTLGRQELFPLDIPDPFDCCTVIGDGLKFADFIGMEVADAKEAPPANSEGEAVKRTFMLTCAPDGAYRNGRISDAAFERKGMLITQKRTDARSRHMDEAQADGLVPRLVVLDTTWSQTEPFADGQAVSLSDARMHEVHTMLAQKDVGLPFAFRTTTHYVHFASDCTLTAADAAFRIAEGNLVIAELQSWGDVSGSPLAETLIAFKERSLAGVLAGCADPRLQPYLDAYAVQKAALDSLPPLEEDLPRLLGLLDAHCAACGKPPVLAMEQAAVPVVLYGWFGALNFGDDLLMLVAAQKATDRYPNAQITVFGKDPAVIAERFGYEAFQTIRKNEAQRCLEGAAALVYCGGLLFDQPAAYTAGPREFMYDHFMEPACQADYALLAALSGVPAVGLGIGAGPLAEPAASKSAQLMGLAGMEFFPRDNQTADLLKRAGVPQSQIDTCADLVLGAADALHELGKRSKDAAELLPDGPFFVVSLRECHLSPAGFEAAVADALDRIVSATAMKAVFLPFSKDDLAIHRRVHGAMAQGANAVLIDRLPDAETMVGVLDASSGAFAMRLHCSIIHHVLGKPAMGLDYNEKVGAHFREIGQENAMVALTADGQAMARAFMGAMAPDNAAAVAEGLKGRTALSLKAYSLLFDRMDRRIGDLRAGANAMLRKRAAASDAARKGDAGSDGAVIDGCSIGADGAVDSGYGAAMTRAADGSLIFYPRVNSSWEYAYDEVRLQAEEAKRALERWRAHARQLEGELEAVRNSHSFRVGHALMGLPGMIKRMVKGE